MLLTTDPLAMKQDVASGGNAASTTVLLNRSRSSSPNRNAKPHGKTSMNDAFDLRIGESHIEVHKFHGGTILLSVAFRAAAAVFLAGLLSPRPAFSICRCSSPFISD